MADDRDAPSGSNAAAASSEAGPSGKSRTPCSYRLACAVLHALGRGTLQDGYVKLPLGVYGLVGVW